MAKTIIIDGVIGWDIYGRSIRNQLNESNGDEIDLQLASPGGYVYDGLEVHNVIRDYNQNTNKVFITIKGLAASMASYISLAVPKDQRFAEDNAVFMIHNVWSFMIGDYREMQKEAKELESLTNLLAKGYSASSGKSLNEIRTLMDDETWYYGNEILDSGFVSKIIDHDKNDNYTKDEKLALSKNSFNRMIHKIKKNEDEAKKDLSRAAALISNKIDLKIPASAGKENKTEVIMTLEELKKNHPELYAQAVQIGKDEEFDRVSAHITMGRQAGNLEMSSKNIEDKKDFTQKILAEYMAEGMKNTAIQNRQSDNPGNTNTNTGGDDIADTKAYEKKLLESRGIKNVK